MILAGVVLKLGGYIIIIIIITIIYRGYQKTITKIEHKSRLNSAITRGAQSGYH